MRKVICIMLLCMLLFQLTACAKDAQPPAAQQEQNAPVQLRIVGYYQMYPMSGYDMDADPIVCWLEQKTGYDLEILHGPKLAMNNEPTPVELALEQNMQADIYLGASMKDADISRLGQEGMLLDLRPYYDDKTGASKVFWQRLAENMTPQQQENMLRTITEPKTGAMYSVPSVYMFMSSYTDYQTWINSQWMQELDLENPTNLEELYGVLKAFQTSYPGCTPLYGVLERGYDSMDLANWLICNFMYFDDRAPFLVSADGTLTPGFTADSYRQALQFIRKLKDEGLLVLEENLNDIDKGKDGRLQYGVVVSRMLMCATRNSENLYAYDILPPLTGQACIYSNLDVRCSNYIAAETEHPAEAFNLMMTMWSEEASYWLRYGEYGVDWTDAEPGSTAVSGYPQKIKVLRDFAYDYSSAAPRKWSIWMGSLFNTDNGINVQYGSHSEFDAYIIQKSVAYWEMYDAAAKENNPEAVCPVLRYTPDSLELRTAVNDYFKTATDEFILGTRDPNSNEDWNQYLSDLEELGLAEYVALAQAAYEYK